MRRSTVPLLLATASLASVLSGCGASSPQAPTPTVSTPAPVTPAPGNPTTPIRVEWQAPTPMSPAAGALTTRRPTLTVGNGERTGTPEGVTYLFEIATDASYTTLVSSGRVSEGAGQTTFRPSADLPAGAAYAWRARASDSSGATSPPSVPRSFNTALKEDGQYRARLVVRSPAWCDTHFTVPPGHGWVSGLPGWVKPDIGVDGMVVVAGARLSYFGTPFLTNSPVRLFDLQWSDGRFVGASNGRVSPDSSAVVPPASASISAVVFSGEVSGGAMADDGWRGTFSGVVTLAQIGFPSERYASCEAADFAWTLLPRP